METYERILALDLATEYGIYDGFTPPSSVKLNRETRALDFFNQLGLLILPDADYPIMYDTIVIENAIGQRAFANEVFHELKAIAKLVAQRLDITFVEYSPAHIKKVFTGDGKADKQKVIDRCLAMGVELPYKVLKSGKNKGDVRYNDNAADAVAIYHTYLINNDLKEDI